MHVHSVANTRNETTNRRSGKTETADPHVTIYLGTGKDHMNLHGHFYVRWPEPPSPTASERELDRLRRKAFQTTPYELMDKRDRRKSPSKITSSKWEARNPELWAWDPSGTKVRDLRGQAIRNLDKW
ncbi:hypothetical protein PG991_008886 [Apiospora marii]|uniref:Uncharacterized protein n=1 Tax=Apiospora marii TaxID=335849 RepID=A0ABR1RM32_9PEZI